MKRRKEGRQEKEARTLLDIYCSKMKENSRKYNKSKKFGINTLPL
jgi:hypothetical protein